MERALIFSEPLVESVSSIMAMPPQRARHLQDKEIAPGFDMDAADNKKMVLEVCCKLCPPNIVTRLWDLKDGESGRISMDISILARQTNPLNLCKRS